MSDHRFLSADCFIDYCNGTCENSVCIPLPSPPAVTIPIAVHHQSRLLRYFLFSAGSFLALSFFLLLVFYFLLRLRHRRHRLQQQVQQAPPSEADGAADDDDLPDDGPHHVWYIRTAGLEESVIKSIAAVVYKSGGGFVDVGDCTVCLGQFEDGEVVKLLPKCSHAFHLSCIDTWLRSHLNCPLCRAPVVVPAAAAEEAENTPIESPEQQETAISIDLAAGAASSSSGPLTAEEEDEVQPVRRSASMDSSSLGMLMLRVELGLEEKLKEERRGFALSQVVISKNKGKSVDCMGPQLASEMKRSLSSRSGRFFFPRYGRGQSASVLPF